MSRWGKETSVKRQSDSKSATRRVGASREVCYCKLPEIMLSRNYKFMLSHHVTVFSCFGQE